MIKEEKGFTLVEILTVLVIIGIIMGLLVSNLSGTVNNTNIGAVEMDMKNMYLGIQEFYIDNRKGDLTEESIYQYIKSELVKYSDEGASLLKFKTVHKEDPWKNPYHLYINNMGEPYVMIHSYGPDEKESITSTSFGDDIVLLFYPENE